MHCRHNLTSTGSLNWSAAADKSAAGEAASYKHNENQPISSDNMLSSRFPVLPRGQLVPDQIVGGRVGCGKTLSTTWNNTKYEQSEGLGLLYDLFSFGIYSNKVYNLPFHKLNSFFLVW